MATVWAGGLAAARAASANSMPKGVRTGGQRVDAADSYSYNDYYHYTTVPIYH